MLLRQYLIAKSVETILEAMLVSEDFPQVFDGEYVYSKPYDSTHGYGFVVYVAAPEGTTRAVFVTESDTSDHIVLTPSFCANYSGVTEAEYERREFFKYKHGYKAARRILEILGDALIEKKKAEVK